MDLDVYHTIGDLYARFTKRLQRCWAHLLREPEDIAEKFEEAIPLYNALKKLYDNERVLYRESPEIHRQNGKINSGL